MLSNLRGIALYLQVNLTYYSHCKLTSITGQVQVNDCNLTTKILFTEWKFSHWTRSLLRSTMTKEYPHSMIFIESVLYSTSLKFSLSKVLFQRNVDGWALIHNSFPTWLYSDMSVKTHTTNAHFSLMGIFTSTCAYSL